jgi:uncharacterized protein DUF6935
MILRFFVAIGLFLGLNIGSSLALAQATQEPEAVVELGLLPPTLQDFQHLQEGAVTPERAATLFIMAMLVHEDFPDIAKEMIIAATTQNNLVTLSDGSMDLLPYMKDHLKRLGKDPAIARSYVTGATPQNDYQIPSGAGYAFKFSRNRLSEVSKTQVRVFVETSGAGTPRPVTLQKQQDGTWRAEEVGSLFVGIYLPASVSR